MALALRHGERKTVPERLAITATVTLDEAGGVATIVCSHFTGTAKVPGLDPADFDAAFCEASASMKLFPAPTAGDSGVFVPSSL